MSDDSRFSTSRSGTVEGRLPEPALWPVLASLGGIQEKEFDEVAELAAGVVGAPFSLLTLVDDVYQYHKGALGSTLAKMPREHIFCEHAFAGDTLLVVTEPKKDPRFSGHPLVTREPGISFYAGLPVYGPSGAKAGVLCVMDSVRRELKPWQARALTLLARQANTLIELRMRRLEAERTAAAVAHSNMLFSTFANDLPFPCYLKDGEHRLLFYNRHVCEKFGVSPQAWLGRTSFDLWPVELATRLLEAEEQVLRTGERRETRVCTPASASRPAMSWIIYQSRCRSATGEPLLAGLMVALSQA